MSVSFETQLTNAKSALTECKSDFEQLIARDQAKAIKTVAGTFDRVVEVQVLASHVLTDAERLIVKSNPRQRWWKKSEPTTQPQIVSNKELKQMRRVHARISDSWYEKLKKKSLDKQIPMTREFLQREIQRRAAIQSTASGSAGAVISGP